MIQKFKKKHLKRLMCSVLARSKSFIKRLTAYFFLRKRWLHIQHKNKAEGKAKESLLGLSSCDIFYINLDHRLDRKVDIENQFKKLGIYHFNRISAVSHRRGSLGCAQSHLSIYNKWQSSQSRLLMICEDDIEFKMARGQIDDLIDRFYHDPRIDVLVLSYKIFNSFRISSHFKISSDIQTTACYVLKPHVISDFKKIAHESIIGLAQGKADRYSAIDIVWKKLQARLIFALPLQPTASQKSSYSDIQNCEVAY